VISAGEACRESALMLACTSGKVIGDAYVQYSRATRHEIDEIGAHTPIVSRLARATVINFSQELRTTSHSLSFSFCFAERPTCHPERSARDARGAKDLLIRFDLHCKYPVDGPLGPGIFSSTIASKSMC